MRYLDSAGAWQTLTGSPSEWHEDLLGEPGRIQPLDAQDWPGTYEVSAAVRIGYTCGYASVGSPDDDDAKRAGVPGLAKNWMQVRIASFFEHRETIITGTFVQTPPRDFIDGLLDGLIVRKRFA